jgi:hypothetical protein
MSTDYQRYSIENQAAVIHHALVRGGGSGGPLATLLDEVDRQSEDWRP